MVASAFLPIALHKGQLFFLFGKEYPGDNAPGYSDFGGGVEPNETSLYKAGLREFCEETTGFFGNAMQMDKLIKKTGGVYKVKHDTYHIHIFKMEYDDKVCEYYNNNHKFIFRITNKNVHSATICRSFPFNGVFFLFN